MEFIDVFSAMFESPSIVLMGGFYCFEISVQV